MHKGFDFADVATLLPKLVFDDAPAGGALTIFKDGQCVVDAAFGQADATMPWTTQTLSVNFSIGKGVMATLIAVLVSQGLLAYDVPIATYWPDFAVNGKAMITLKDVLSHQAGLFNLTQVMTSPEDLLDFSAMIMRVAQMAIETPIGQATHGYGSAYSALVSGWILGGLVERVTQMSLQAALDNFLAAPLGLVGQLYFGVPKDKLDKIALPYRLFDGDDGVRKKPVLKPDSSETKAFLQSLPITNLWQEKLANPDETLSTATINRLYFDPSKMNLVNYKNALLYDNKSPINYYRQDLLQVPIPAANGLSTSYALAVLYAMHANDGVWQNQVLINQPTLMQMRAVQTTGYDAVMPADMRWRMGFHRLFSLQKAENAYGHMGYNGSLAFCDVGRGLSVAFIHNFDTTMLNDVRQFVITESALLASADKNG